jgi:hypothetical protein
MNDSISFALTTPMTNGEQIKFILSINNGVYTRSDTITKYFGQPLVVFASDGNSTASFNPGQWGITNSTWYSPSGSITDSPSGNYLSNQLNVIRMSNNVDLTNAIKAELSFYAKWALEANYDYVQVQASVDNGQTWSSLCGKYTVEGGNFQAPGEPLYEGFQNSWVREEISLDDYIGYNVQVRLILSSDGFLEYDGFYFDDFLITKTTPGINAIDDNEMELSKPLIYPNPSSIYAYINYKKVKENTSLVITDKMGRVVLKKQLQTGSESVRIEVNSITSGVYFVNIIGESGFSPAGKLLITK